MNALAMKLESRKQLTFTNGVESNTFTGFKKCKGSRSLSTDNDKDALLKSNGLGRKFCDQLEIHNVNINSSKTYTCKKKSLMKLGLKVDKMFTESDKIQERLQRSLSIEDKEKIFSILNEIRSLSDIEKLFLYLQLPTGSSFDMDPFKQKIVNPLGKKAEEEGMFAVTWIQSHLEEDPDVSLPKQEVYDEYQSYCNLTGTDPLCAADFGKVMKQIFPSVKPRRLGTRGNSRYCYSGLRKKLKLEPPSIPDIQKEKDNNMFKEDLSNEVTAASCHLLYEWAEKLLGMKFSSLKELAAHLLENMYVDNRSVAAFTVLLDASPQLLNKGCPAGEGGVKKTEAQFHLQRKIQEKELIKEQKRKLQEQRTNFVSLNKGKGSSGKKKNRKAQPSSPDLLPEKDNEGIDMKKCEEILFQVKNSELMLHSPDLPVDVVMPDIEIKKEEDFVKLQANDSNDTKITDVSLSSVLASPLSSPDCGPVDVEDPTKVTIQTVTTTQQNPSVQIAQSLPGIIIVPSLSQITSEIGKQNGNLPKYKRIQPKPLQGELLDSVARSRSGSVGSCLPIKPKSRNADGRRSSHACLQSDLLIERNEEKSYGGAPLKAVQDANKGSVCLKSALSINKFPSATITNGNNVEKRKFHISPRLIIESGYQINDTIGIDDSSSVKRHLDDNEDHINNKRVHLEPTNELTWTPNPNKHIGMGQEEVSVNEIEGDALNDYFRGANNQSLVHQNDLEQQNSTTNKVQQLSQLRMLLEQNLPGAISKTSLSSNKIQKVSKNIDTNGNISDSSTFPEAFMNNVLENPLDSSNAANNPLEVDAIENILSSSYLAPGTEINVDSQMLSDPNMFLQNNVHAIDANLQSDFNQNSRTDDSVLVSALSNDLVTDQVNAAAIHMRVNTCTQVPSVPQSPNTRRRAFNFMPISPRHTPVPDGISMNNVSSPHVRMMMSTGVGPSQPPSNSGSPFVSPRSTPVPLSRSRHGSGQSTYSTSCHTPFQNFDSGVSSVSTSPFISPQPTPVPVSRLRHHSSHGSKTVTFYSISSPQVINTYSLSNTMRTRHSSGPGPPRSSSLSPLVTEQSSTPSFVFPSNSEMRSRHNSGSNATTPLSPVSEQASSSSSCASNILDLSGVNDVSQSFLNDGAGDLLISANPTSLKQVRHRHASSSLIYGKPSLYSQKDIFSHEIQKLLKNCDGTPDLLLSNRSQSVPLHQMLQTADGLYFLQSVEDSCPKSHPSTPVMNQMFSFPSLGTHQEVASLSPSLDVNSRDKMVVQNSQMEWTGLDGSSELETSSARRNLAVLYDAPPPSDDLQTTLEDLRDCDTDFSKLELELRQSDENGL